MRLSQIFSYRLVLQKLKQESERNTVRRRPSAVDRTQKPKESERNTVHDKEEEISLIFKTSATYISLQDADIPLMDPDGFETNSTIRIIVSTNLTCSYFIKINK